MKERWVSQAKVIKMAGKGRSPDGGLESASQENSSPAKKSRALHGTVSKVLEPNRRRQYSEQVLPQVVTELVRELRATSERMAKLRK